MATHLVSIFVCRDGLWVFRASTAAPAVLMRSAARAAGAGCDSQSQGQESQSQSQSQKQSGSEHQ